MNGKRAAPSTGCTQATRSASRRCGSCRRAEPGTPLGRADRAHRAAHHSRGRAAARARQAGRRGRAWRQRRQLRRDRGAAGAAPGEYLELVHRLDRDTSGCLLVARRAPRAAHAARAAARRTASRSATSRCSRGTWNLGAQAHRRAAASPIPAWAASAPCEWRRRGKPRSATSGRCSSSAARDLDGGRARDRPHAPDPRARRSTPATRSRAMRSTATRSSTRRCARSVCGGCSCTPQPELRLAAAARNSA